MKLFHAKGSCSLGIRILLEEIGASYELATLQLANGEQKAPDYLAQNPKGKVPALLRPDGRILTEYPVISLWLAQNFPQANLLPSKPEDFWPLLELVEYVVSSLHMRGATLVLRPEKFVTDPEGQKAIAQEGRAVLQEGLARLQSLLGDKEFFFDRFTIADAAVFYLLNWQPRLGLELPQNLASFHSRIAARDSVKKSLV